MDSSLKSELLHQQLKEGNPTLKPPIAENQYYNTPVPEKKLVIIWHTGNMADFIYSHLVSREFNLDQELNTITLKFLRDTLILKGYNLSVLYFHFLRDDPYFLNIADPRYVASIPEDDFILIDAKIKS